MKIKVTQEHINKGTQMEACYCPIALAIKEQLHTHDVTVGIERVIYRTVEDPLVTKNLPEEAQKFIVNFDKDRTSVKPFEFELI